MITEKLAVDADNFGLQGADIFDGVFKNSLNLQKSQLVGFCATLQAEVDKEAAIFFREQGDFRICAIYDKISPNDMYCTPLSSHDAKHQ